MASLIGFHYTAHSILLLYNNIRNTSGELNAHQQINAPTVNKHYFKPSFSALDCEINLELHPCSTSTSESNKGSEECDDSFNYPSEVFDDNTDQLENDDDTKDFTLTNLDATRNAIASTFRGFCCELFVFSKCMKKESTCNFDHSTKAKKVANILFSYLRNVTSVIMLIYHRILSHFYQLVIPTKSDTADTSSVCNHNPTFQLHSNPQPFLSTQIRDHPASLTNFESTSTHIFDPGTAIFDPDRQICNALLDHLLASTSLHCSTGRVRSTTLLRPLFLRIFSFTQRS